MKSVFLVLFAMVLSFQAEASKSAVYCKVEGQIYDALSEEGFGQCYLPLTGGVGEACYVGSRTDIIQIINADSFNWDENWLERANYKGASDIFYVYADGPAEEKFAMSLGRCDSGFFKK